MSSTNKINIFGGSGFIGSKFVDLYRDEVIVNSREDYEPQSDNILYFISTVDNYNIWDNPQLDIETNLTLLIDVLEKCKKNKNTVFNFISSWFVYGKTKDLPAHEETHCNPTGFYSITKRAAEQLLSSYCETFGLNYRILRLCNVYGAQDKKASAKKNAPQFLVSEVVNNQDIKLYDRGENIRDFMHVEDICRAIRLVIEKMPLNEIINVGSGKPHKIIDLMNYVKKQTGSTSAFDFIEAPSFHQIVQIKNMYLDASKLQKLGFSPRISIEEGLNKLIKDSLQYGKRNS